ncbi:RNA methyltransferase [Quillaja saponaria]|uniref:RNA methyltransferase n=1 Tax=Quillaja saponaria TaxID=32244 RepID=A0AAD7Q4L6_QUISA|nr:RNA methyltransferase [Quillaja saponaria]
MMPFCLLSARQPSPFISCQASSTTVHTHFPPTQPPSAPGCTHELNLHRPSIADEATDFFKSIGVSGFSFDSCKLWGWRCRAKLAVRGSSINPLIGLYQEGTHNVVDIPDCKAHHPNINAAVELLKQGITEVGVEPHDEDEGTGDLRYIQMAVTTYNTSLPAAARYKNGKVQVSLVWNSRNENSPSSDKLNALANFLWRKGGPRSNFHLIHSVWVNFQTSTNNIIFGNRWRHLLGERDFWEHVGGIDISLAPSSFGQANTRAFDILLRKLHKYLPQESADLLNALRLTKIAKVSFEKTIERLPIPIEGSITWHHADASREPLSWLVGSDVVVIDPPRKGLDPSLIGLLRNISSVECKVKSTSQSSNSTFKEEKRPWVLRARDDSVHIGSKTISENSLQSLPQTLIYISCGWERFKEDCKSLLSSKAWHLEKAHGFNFFPGTLSIEVLAVFKRDLKKKKSGKKKKG